MKTGVKVFVIKGYQRKESLEDMNEILEDDCLDNPEWDFNTPMHQIIQQTLDKWLNKHNPIEIINSQQFVVRDGHMYTYFLTIFYKKSG